MEAKTKIALSTIEVSTWKYQASHGKKPATGERSWGMWLFSIGSEVFDFTGKYGDAVKAAKLEAQSRGFHTVVVLP